MEAAGKGEAPAPPACLPPPPPLANAPAKRAGLPGPGQGLGLAHGAAGRLAIIRSCCAMSSNACATLLISRTEELSAIWVGPLAVGGAAGKLQDVGSPVGAAAPVYCCCVPSAVVAVTLQSPEHCAIAAGADEACADVDGAAGGFVLLFQLPLDARWRAPGGVEGVAVKAAACRWNAENTAARCWFWPVWLLEVAAGRGCDTPEVEVVAPWSEAGMNQATGDGWGEWSLPGEAVAGLVPAAAGGWAPRASRGGSHGCTSEKEEEESGAPGAPLGGFTMPAGT